MNGQLTKPSIGQELANRRPQFAASLKGSGIDADRFARAILTSLQRDVFLSNAARANPRSFYRACMEAAGDQLIPDGKEGALVAFDDTITWMPMVMGIRKKVWRSGEISKWDVKAVFEKDLFDYGEGDEPFVKHKPYLPPLLTQKEGESDDDFAARRRASFDRGPLSYVYSICKLKNGEISQDVMSVAQVLYVRDTYAKKSKKTKEYSPAWRKSFPEMACKTIAHHHSKVLPMPDDVRALFTRDAALYNVEEHQGERVESPQALSDRLDFLADYDISRDEPPEPSADSGELGESGDGDFSVSSPSPQPPEFDQSAQRPPQPSEPQRPSETVLRGDAMAKQGRAALDGWLTQLPPDQMAKLPLATITAWRVLADGAGARA